MKPEFDKKLCEKYPKIFAQRNLPMDQTCMCWGFECGDGWYWLIYQLCNAIQKYIDANEREQVEAVQVKEKFGSLRFYISGGDDTVYGMINLAEHLSWEICESCGSTENITHTKGWIRTICQKCLRDSKKVEGTKSPLDIMLGDSEEAKK